MEGAHNGPLSSQGVGSHHEMGDNKAPGGPTSLTSSVSSGVSGTFHGYEDPPGLHEKVPQIIFYLIVFYFLDLLELIFLVHVIISSCSVKS